MQRPIASYRKLLWTLQLLAEPRGKQKRTYEEGLRKICLLKSNIFTLPRNKTGFKFTDTLNEILSATLNDSNAETAMYCEMVMPHLNLARTRTEDEASNNKINARRLDQWIKWDIESLFLEAKVIQECMSRTNAKRIKKN